MSLVESVGVQDLFEENRVSNFTSRQSAQGLQELFRDFWGVFKGGRGGGSG